jgi:transposase
MSQNEISKLLGSSRNTIRKVKLATESIHLTWNDAARMTDDEFVDTIFPKRDDDNDSLQPKPDCEMMYKELQKPGVTRALLWEEYAREVKAAGKIPLQYSQFCNYFKHYLEINKATMHFEHKIAERIEVDWSGTTIPIVDELTGEVSNGYLFVATLPYSQYSYAEVMNDMKQENWIMAHVHMFNFFGGTTPIIYPDNLKTGVIKHPKNDDVILNKAYQEMGDYYDVAIVPTLPRSPKGKPSVEGTVGKIKTHIIARLRKMEFHSIKEANSKVRICLDDFNSKPFQKRDGSRSESFFNEEKMFLRPLPKEPYEYAIWKVATVQYNYHIAVGKMYYSVPYEYIKQKVDVRITKNMIEIYYKHNRICSHRRLYGQPGQYSTNTDHMPLNHQKAGEWNGDRFRKWARSIGPKTFEVIDNLLNHYKAEQQAYNGCRSILKLSDKYSSKQLENACDKALEHLALPRYKNIKLIIQYNQDTKEENNVNEDTDNFAIIRGSSYYGGDNNE